MKILIRILELCIFLAKSMYLAMIHIVRVALWCIVYQEEYISCPENMYVDFSMMYFSFSF